MELVATIRVTSWKFRDLKIWSGFSGNVRAAVVASWSKKQLEAADGPAMTLRSEFPARVEFCLTGHPLSLEPIRSAKLITVQEVFQIRHLFLSHLLILYIYTLPHLAPSGTSRTDPERPQ